MLVDTAPQYHNLQPGHANDTCELVLKRTCSEKTAFGISMQQPVMVLACLPDPMVPVDKLSHRFSLTPVSAQAHCEGSLGMVLPVLAS